MIPTYVWGVWVCKKKWVESNGMCIEKLKQKKDICLMVCLFANVFQLQSFVWIQKYFIKIIFVWEIIMIDKFFDSIGSLHQGL